VQLQTQSFCFVIPGKARDLHLIYKQWRHPERSEAPQHHRRAPRLIKALSPEILTHCKRREWILRRAPETKHKNPCFLRVLRVLQFASQV
jgi:hypothetical protein